MMTRINMFVAAGTVAARALLAQSPTTGSAAAPQVLPPERQIAAAVLPLPAELQAGATVLGYAPDGRLVRLRAGTNHMVCLADDPREDRFHVACYHDSLEPFMARGRDLRARGLGPGAVDSVRFADVAAGRIHMPPAASLYSLTGPAGSYDTTTGALRGGRRLFVVYVPFATEASTGLSATPRGNSPWLMDPGTAKAHIMYALPM